MSVYGRDFAEVYSRFGYSEFSARVAKLLPKVLARLHTKPREILDMTCGEGTFAVAMAKKGYRVSGVDRSAGMLTLARRKAREAHVNVRFIKKDVRSLPFKEEFDLVTSWYDSLNYLLRSDDLARAFAGAFRALRPGGVVEVDARNAFVVHRSTWNARSRVATLKVTCFVRHDGRWSRIDELHRERAYQLPAIRSSLRRAGFVEVACWGSIRHMTPPRRGDRKYWIGARRPPR